MVWRAHATDVWATAVDGKLVVNEGRYLAGDEAAIVARAAAVLEKVEGLARSSGILAQGKIAMAGTFKAVHADGYNRIMGRFSASLAGQFIAFTGHRPGEKILDVGCGTGSLSFALAARGDHKEIVGIDAR